LEAFTEKHQPIRKSVNIKKLLKQTIKLFRLRLPETISIHQDLGAADITLLGDSARLHRAIMNLLKNAQESFDGHPGTVSIGYETLELVPGAVDPNGSLSPGTYVKISIQDSGRGMDQETLDQIFDPYFTTKKGGVGTGIGLSIVKRIIHEHGGDITVSSIPREGTNVDIYLPHTVEEAGAQRLAPDSLPRGNEKILVIDDEELLTSILARMLTSLGYHVTKVNSAKEALEVYRQSHEDIDLVITDWAMPEITGDHLAKMMLRINRKAKVVLFSAFEEGFDAEALFSSGIREILKKPIVMEKLAVVVRKVLDAEP